MESTWTDTESAQIHTDSVLSARICVEHLGECKVLGIFAISANDGVIPVVVLPESHNTQASSPPTLTHVARHSFLSSSLAGHVLLVFGGPVRSGFRPPVPRTEIKTGSEKSQTVKRPNWTGR